MAHPARTLWRGLPRGATRNLDRLRGKTAVAQRPNLTVLASLTYEAGPIGSDDLGTAKVVRVPSGREVALSTQANTSLTLVSSVIRSSCMKLVQKDPMEEEARDTQSSHLFLPTMRPERPDMQN